MRNTQLRERPATRTPIETTEARPRPVWTDPEEGGQPSQPARRMGPRIALVSAMAATAAVVVWVIASSIPTGEPVQSPAFDSPGGNSLNILAVDAPAVSAAFDSPGGNSLNILAVDAPAVSAAFDSPGGNSLNVQPRVVSLSLRVRRPGLIALVGTH